MEIVYRKILSRMAGDELIVYEEEGKFFWSLDCAFISGLAYEIADHGPFYTLNDAVAAALEWYKKQNF